MEQLIVALWAVDTFKGLFIIALLSLTAIIAISLISAANASDSYTNNNDIWERARSLKKYAILCGIVIIAWTVTPSHKIILMYAGLKGGEAIMNTPEFEKARELFNKTIDGYLKEEERK